MKKCKEQSCNNPPFRNGFCPLHGDYCIKAPDNAGMEFIYKAIEDPSDVECIRWPYGKVRGYGCVEYNGRTDYASRVALELYTGEPAPEGMEAAHEPTICHNPACINPKHLRWATHKENMADKYLDGTGGRVLNDAEARDIKQSRRSAKALADEYQVCPTTISRIKNR